MEGKKKNYREQEKKNFKSFRDLNNKSDLNKARLVFILKAESMQK